MSLGEMKKVASAQFCADVHMRTESQQRLIMNGAYLMWRFFADYDGSDRSMLSEAQLLFLIERGVLGHTPQNRAVRAVGIFAWYFSDPEVYPPEVKPPEGLAPLRNKLIYLAVVVDRRNEVLGEWRISPEDL